jgi:hypothetical protein
LISSAGGASGATGSVEGGGDWGCDSAAEASAAIASQSHSTSPRPSGCVKITGAAASASGTGLTQETRENPPQPSSATTQAIRSQRYRFQFRIIFARSDPNVAYLGAGGDFFHENEVENWGPWRNDLA